MSDDSDVGLTEQAIRDWLRREVMFPDKSRGRCDLVKLKHLNISRAPQGDVTSFPVKLEEEAEADVDVLARDIAVKAQEDADTLNAGVQLYAIYAQFTVDKTYCPRKVFRVAGSSEIERDIKPSEPPTEAGLVSQTMRHLEAVMKTATVSSGYLVSSQQREISRLADMNEKFMQQQVDMMILMQDMADRGHERRLKEKSSEVGIAMKESAMSKLEALVSVIINRIAGKPVVPEDDKSFLLMASLFESMSADQQMTLYGMLTDAQKISLAEILHGYEEKRHKYAESKKIPPTTGQAQIAAPKSDKTPQNLLVESQSLPMFKSLGERAKDVAAETSSDPQIKKIEDDVSAFTNRFRDFLKPPTNGDKR
jgi:hypothetical protein